MLSIISGSAVAAPLIFEAHIEALPQAQRPLGIPNGPRRDIDDVVGAQTLGELKSRGTQVRANDEAGAHVSSDRDGHQPDRAAAADKHIFADARERQRVLHRVVSPVPFGEAMRRHAQAVAGRDGGQRAREVEIATIADDLLDRAVQGPQDRSTAACRVTGRTSATATNRTWPTPPEPDPGPEPDVTAPLTDRRDHGHHDLVDDVEHEIAEVPRRGPHRQLTCHHFGPGPPVGRIGCLKRWHR
jgi:hypothetical protein